MIVPGSQIFTFQGNTENVKCLWMWIMLSTNISKNCFCYFDINEYIVWKCTNNINEFYFNLTLILLYLYFNVTLISVKEWTYEELPSCMNIFIPIQNRKLSFKWIKNTAKLFSLTQKQTPPVSETFFFYSKSYTSQLETDTKPKREKIILCLVNYEHIFF